MSATPSELLRVPPESLALDRGRVIGFLQNQELIPASFRAEDIRIKQFGHGQSNPTYCIQVPGQKDLVLRKQPPGKLLASAHAVDREFAVLTALQGTPVPVPNTHCLCQDASVLGSTFYIMDFVPGRIYLDVTLPFEPPRRRSQVYRTMARTLASLHTVDPSKLGLSNFGRPQGINARQCKRWHRQYLLSTQPGTGNPRLAEMLRLAQALQVRAGVQDKTATGGASIVHGDYRLDNLVFEERGERCLAVLDWELSTLGDPLADLAYNCLVYHLPPCVKAMGHMPTPLPEGIPSEADHVSEYCQVRGIARPGSEAWAFYVSLGMFRAASILSGVFARSRLGNASAGNAAEVGAPAVVRDMAVRALQHLEEVSGARHPISGTMVQPVQSRMGQLLSEAHALGPSPHCHRLRTRLNAFIAQHVLKADSTFEAHAHGLQRWEPFPLMESLKSAARQEGLWNLWIAPDLSAKLVAVLTAAGISSVEAALLRGPNLSNLDYAYLAREMGGIPWCSEVFNCSAPDTGNMEVLARFGSLEQQRHWLVPLLRGEIRSCFAMTETSVASSDATNIRGSVDRSGDHYIVSGQKCWISGACDTRCRVVIFMGKNDPSAPTHRQQCMILVPMDAPGVHVRRPMTVFGEDDAPHGHAEITFERVRVHKSCMILGEGEGFAIAQGRLGPGRLHHCMRAVGIGEAALRLTAARVKVRHAFGAVLARSPLVQAQLGEAWLRVHVAWLSVLHAASLLDQVSNKEAQLAITAAKVVTPRAVIGAIDLAIQLHGAAGVGQDTPLARWWGAIRTLRLADGPDEVHQMSIGKRVISKL